MENTDKINPEWIVVCLNPSRAFFLPLRLGCQRSRPTPPWGGSGGGRPTRWVRPPSPLAVGQDLRLAVGLGPDPTGGLDGPTQWRRAGFDKSLVIRGFFIFMVIYLTSAKSRNSDEAEGTR
jgi:hypothetical protein